MADVSVEARERMKTEYIREDRTVEGWYIETHYTPCKGIADANGYLRVLVDEEGYDTETRILHETLNGIGWVKSAALSANNQERAEAVPLKVTGKWESCRVADYNQGWNDALAATSTTPQAPTAEPLISKEWLAEKLAACHDDAIGASQPKRPCDTPPGCNAGNCLRCGEVKPTAEPVDPAYPFYELKFIMRVLSHKGGAPKQDWDTAYGMAREIFSRWHKDRQSTAEGQTKQGRAADGAVSDTRDFLTRFVQFASESNDHTLDSFYRGINRLANEAHKIIATQPPSASPVAVPKPSDDEFLCQAWGETDLPCVAIVKGMDAVHRFLIDQWLNEENAHDWPEIKEDLKTRLDEDKRWDAEFEIGGISVTKVWEVAATQPALPDAGLDSQKREYLQPADLGDLMRFQETTDDSEGYDIGKPAIKRLAELGVVQSHGFGKYSMTAFGHFALEHMFCQNPRLPLITNDDRDVAAIATSKATS